MSDRNGSEPPEGTRLCPACRMPISVLATKCRYCGDMVSRQRKEDRQLTVTDLGGEASSQYGLSDEALDALEAYRREEYLDSEPAGDASPRVKDSEPGRKETPSPLRETAAVSSPEKPAGHSPKPPPRTSQPKVRSSSPRAWDEDKARKTAIVVGGFLAFFVIVFFAKWMLDSYLANRSHDDSTISVDNRAIGILEGGGPGIEALEAACEALRQANTPENQTVMDQAREKMKADVYKLLNMTPLELKNLDKASELASRAEKIDPDSVEMRELYAEVNDEIRMYKMTITQIDRESGEVILQVFYPNPHPDLLLKHKEDLIHNRFKVQEIASEYVRFQDMKRKSLSGRPREFRLFLSGEIVGL